ncbi:MAG: AAA family ATPase [Theionarchaea archaeon]|nr:MAG: cytidylate kinase [Theionarchaea archaeon DG-70-1]MBU7026874.1 AAA family ATPase [Theionarchaea archaeon]
MIITVGGFPGSGTTTLSKKLCNAFGLTHVYAGQIFREMAQSKGISLEEFSKQAEADETIDLEVDQRQKELAKENTVVDGRIAAHMVEADLKIWLSASLDVRVKRVSGREHISYEESLRQVAERETSEKKRYKKYYTIDIDDISVYDLAINTDLWDAEGVFQIVKAAIEVREW